MKRPIIIIGALAMMAAISASCSKDDIDTYNVNYSSVRFASKNLQSTEDTLGGSYQASDSTLRCTFSFIDCPDSDSYTYDVPLVLIGKTADYDRKVNVEIDAARSNAKDYEIVSASIPANQNVGSVKVKFQKTEALTDSTYELYMHLLPSDDFMASPDSYSKAYLAWNNQITLPTGSRLVRTYNMLIKSSLSFVSSNSAVVSPNAMRAIVAALGWNDWDDVSVHGYKANRASTHYYKYLPAYTWIYVDSSYKGYAATLADYLAEYEQTHGTPLLHDAGAYKGRPVEARQY